MREKFDAEVIAEAAIDAGKNWTALMASVKLIADSGLSKRAVVALISDECHVAMYTAEAVLDALAVFPTRHLSLVAA